MDVILSLNKTEKGFGPKQPKLVWPGLACMGVAYWNLKFIYSGSLGLKGFSVLFIPSRGTDMEVDGIISARSKKNTVNESRIEMDKDTCKENRFS